MTRARIIRLVAVVVVLVCTVGCDQATKHLARTSLSQTGSVTFSGSCLQFGMLFLAASWRAGPHKDALNKSSAMPVKASWMRLRH
jgi:hypothetical protein